MSKWGDYKLGDLIDVKHGFAFKGEFITTEPTAAVLVTPGNFNIGGGFKASKFKYYKGEYPASYILDEGDVVVTMTDLSQEGDTLGYSAKIPMHNKCKFLHNQRIGLVKMISDEADKDFIYWVMRTAEYQGFIVGAASGTSIRHTSPSTIKEYTFELPPLPEQIAIASILSSLDDKINLLSRQSKTLEALAETLFRQWFVEERKEGWETTSLFDVIELVGGGTPKTEVAGYWNGSIKWISARDITPNHKGFITETEKKITELGIENSSAKTLPKYSTIISARGTVGTYCLLSEDMAFSQSNYGIKPRYKDCYFVTYLLVAESVNELQAAAYGSVFDTITTTTFKEHKIQVPPESEILSFEKGVGPYFIKMLSNCTQIRTLTRLRDTLLPKLMNREVQVTI